MSTSYVLDTSVVVLFFNQDAAIRARVNAEHNLYISSTALGELFYGAEHSHNVANSLNEVEELAKLTNVLGTDLETARIFGRIKHQQRAKGLMLPDNDLWIAATALHYGLTLAARDAHFTWVDGLAQEQW